MIVLTETRIEFVKSPFALKDDIKALAKSRWHGFEDPPRKIWSVENCPRNLFSLQMMIGGNPYEFFDRPLETHEYDRPLMGHQSHMSDAGLTYHYQIWGAEMGCISGDAIVHIRRGPNHSHTMTIRDLCDRFHGAMFGSQNAPWRRDIETSVLAYTGDGIKYNRIKNVLNKGPKKVVKLTTTNKTLTLTPDHEVCVSDDGYGKFVRVDKLKKGDLVMVKIPRTKGLSMRVMQTPPEQLTKIAKQGLLFKINKKLNRGYVVVYGLPNHLRGQKEGVREHILVMEEYLGRYLKSDEEIHHINGQKWDNRLKNLLLCKNHAEHCKHHSGHNMYAHYNFEKVVSVEDAGTTDVYDIMCEGPYHNFVVNEIVVSNCGKTLSAIEVIERSGFNDCWWVGPKSALYAVTREFKKWELDPRINLDMMTYENLTKRMKMWTEGDDPPPLVIFDESSRLKSPKSQRSQASQALADGIRAKYGNDGYVILMSGTPAPKSPMDWWKPAEICYPGYLKEGNPIGFKLRLGICSKQENKITGQTFLQHVTWRDDEDKCDVCGGFDRMKPRPIDEEVLPIDEEVLYCEEEDHRFTPSKNEVSYLYERLKGLVIIKHKKDCLDLPDKRYRVIRCESTPAMRRVAKTLMQAAPSTITGLTWLRELSDGFQYRNTEDGLKTCPTCKGECTIGYWVDPEDSEKAYTMTEMLDPDYVSTLEKTPLPCMSCRGTGEVTNYIRTVKTIPCPKDAALINLLGENEEQGRVVIFAGFTGSIDKITTLCAKEQWAVVRVDGRGWVTYDEEGNRVDVEPLDYWADLENNTRVAFVAHPKSGGMGLTLIEARMAIYYSNSYESESRTQSEDRISRIGITKGAIIVDLIHLPTDEAVLNRLKQNRRLELMTLGSIENCFGT